MTHYSSLITHDSSLVTLKRRARLRWLLERLRIGLLWGLAGGGVILVAGRLLGETAGPFVALVCCLVSLIASLAAGMARWPSDWSAARAADDLGLQERVSSALYAAQTGHPLAPMLAREAGTALARLAPSDYPLIPHPRRWRLILPAALLAMAAVLVPIPTLGDGGHRAAQAKSVAESRETVKRLQAALPDSPTPVPLARAAASELQALDEKLARAQSAEEAARAMDEYQERLASLGQRDDYAWQRALEGLAAAWGQNPDLGAVAQAVRSRDPQAVERALAELAARVEGAAPEQRQQLQIDLQAGANAARDVPQLAAALRQAAQQAGTAEGAASGTPGGTSAGLGDLSPMMSQGVARSAALQSVQQALTGLGRARAALGAASRGAAGSGSAAGGSSTAGAASAQGGAGQGASGAGGSGSGTGGSGSGTGSSSAQGSGTGSSGGSGTGSGSGTGAGSGSGSGTGSGSGSGGSGGSGGGSGAGAGAGGGPAQGRPGAGNAGATMAGGSAAPSNRGATNYEKVYAPNLLGGDGGPRVEAPGDAVGASGETVDLPNSPLELGELRPYDQVYSRYEAEARQSVARQSLPPALQGLVQRYYSSIDPNNE